MKHTWGKNKKTVKEYRKQVWKITKMAAGVAEKCFWLSKTFSGSFCLVVYPSWKSMHVKIHTKMTQFLVGFWHKVKSDKLASIEGKVLNLMFLEIYIPAVPIENWLQATHNHRRKTLKVASVFLFRHILKTNSCLECGSSLSNSRMWPGILCVAIYSK